MTYKIKKGKHRAWPLSLGLWYDKIILKRIISFYPSCKYYLLGEDQEDTNKLFGIGYLFNHHKDSARFGWTYNNVTGKIIVSAYCYINGVRKIYEICEVNINEPYVFEINITPDFYEFEVRGTFDMYVVKSTRLFKEHKNKCAFPLGFYFGGNKKAPHDMTIEIKKL